MAKSIVQLEAIMEAKFSEQEDRFNRKIELTETILNTKLSTLQSTYDTFLKSQAEVMLNTFKGWVNGVKETVDNCNFTIGKLEGNLEEIKNSNAQNIVADSKCESNFKSIKTITQDLENLSAKINKMEYEYAEDALNRGWTKVGDKAAGPSNVVGGDALTQLISRVDNLEDASRRDNIIFYGVDEAETLETWDECENHVKGIIHETNLLGEGDHHSIEIVRAHRIGKRDDKKPRPIIAKFARYKVKDTIMKNAKNLASSTYNISEDFSKNTNDTRKKLLDHGKGLTNRTSTPIKSFHVNYKTLNVLTSSGNRYNFNLDFISKNHSTWHTKIAE